jgi:Universal stress protein family
MRSSARGTARPITGQDHAPGHPDTRPSLDPPGGDLADRRSPCGYLRRVWAEDASRRLDDALAAAWGILPRDLPVRPVVERGEAGPVLAAIACGHNDLLVVGAGSRSVLARIVSGRVSRYCLARAKCPILAIPPPALTQEVSHGLLRWAYWHRALTPDQVLRDQGKTAALPPRTTTDASGRRSRRSRGPW